MVVLWCAVRHKKQVPHVMDVVRSGRLAGPVVGVVGDERNLLSYVFQT